MASSKADWNSLSAGTKVIMDKCNTQTEDIDSAEFYDKWAGNYDKSQAELNVKTHIYMGEKVKALLGDVTNVDILDVACGTGILGKQLRALGFTSVDGVDISPKMAEIAVKNYVYGRILISEITDQPIEGIESGSYDLITVCNAIGRNHVRPSCFEEFRRILKKGGYMVLSKYTDEAVVNDVVELEDALEQYYMEGAFQLISCTSYADMKFGSIPGNIYVLKVLKNRR